MTTAATHFDWRLERCGDPVMIATHRRSGTHLLIDFIRRQFPSCQSWKLPGENTNRLYLPMGGLARGRLTKPLARRIIARPKRPILKTHSLPTFDLQQGGYEALVKWAHERGRIMYCLRDCRAVMASLYAYMQSFDAQARVQPGEFLRQTAPLPEFKLESHASLSRPAQWAHHVREWLTQEDVLVVRYEDVLKQPRGILDALSTHLDMQPTYREPLLPAKFSRSFLARLGRRVQFRPASTAIISPRAPGVEHSWRKLFRADDLAYIWDEAGDVLSERGYTRDE
jgi:hypothetical protein